METGDDSEERERGGQWSVRAAYEGLESKIKDVMVYPPVMCPRASGRQEEIE